MLPLLGAAAEQDDDRIAIPPEINSIAGPKIDSIFEHPTAHSLHIREIRLPYPCERNRDFRGGLCIETAEPTTKRTSAVRIQVFKNQHFVSIIYVTNYGKGKAGEGLANQTLVEITS